MAVRRDSGALPGSYRGAPPRAGGTGSGQGPSSANVTTPPLRGRRRLRGAQDSGWTPTVAYLVILVALEIGAYCALRWAFRTAHGG